MNDYSSLARQAILAALSSNWEEALRINQEIIEHDPKNIEALNRLGRTYFELGNFNNSKKHFEKALLFDPYNQIAAKFLKRIKSVSKTDTKDKSTNNYLTQLDNINLSPDLFIEEPGKTKVVTLLKVAEPKKLSMLSAGVPVQMVIKNHGVIVTDPNNIYLGIIPDDLSHHLIRLIKGGNKYSCFIKTIKTNSLSILIREIFRASKFRNQPSFLDNQGANVVYSVDNLVVAENIDEEEPPFESDEEENII